MDEIKDFEEIIENSKELPTLPGIALRILETIQKDDADLKALGEILSTDPPLSAKVLRTVNSPFYGLASKITSVPHAINLLGIDTVKYLALSFSLVQHFGNGNGTRFNYPLFWKASLISAISSKSIANEVLPDKAEDAFFLGLLHNIGILALNESIPQRYGRVLEETNNGCYHLHELEEKILGLNHMEIGKLLVENWGLPEIFSVPIHYHHSPRELRSGSHEITALTRILHLASLFSEFFNLPDKAVILGQIEWFAKEYDFFGPSRVEMIGEHIQEQAMNIFPFFEIGLKIERDYSLMIERARKELKHLPSEREKEDPDQDGYIELQKAGIQKQKNERILIVDDEQRNVKLLNAMLMAEKYDLHGVYDGAEAIELTHTWKPDLILLDIMMPGLDGFEVSKRLKDDELTKPIPILMITALKDKEHRLKAMECGADDFLNKPIDRIELITRVKSLLRSKAYYEDLIDSNRKIHEKNRQLIALEKAKDSLTQMIVHDLNNPLTAIAGSIELLLLDDPASPTNQKETARRCQSYCNDLIGLVQDLLDIQRMEEAKLDLKRTKTDLIGLVKELLRQFKTGSGKKEADLRFFSRAEIPEIEIDSRLIKRVVGNLLSNAVRHSPKKSRMEISLDLLNEKSRLLFSIRDYGDGLAPEYHQKIFDRYEQVSLRRAGVKVGTSGLGLAFCKMAVEAHGGRIWVESEGEGKGSKFSFILPTKPPSLSRQNE
jgi:signal transduction histidine kinase/HD-like signal output (HDOD) protein